MIESRARVDHRDSLVLDAEVPLPDLRHEIIVVSDVTAGVDSTVTARWKLDHHHGCATSRFIDLRYVNGALEVI